jgi:hypothetical protein
VIGLIVVIAGKQNNNPVSTTAVDIAASQTAGVQSIAATATAACQFFESQYPATPCP